MKNEDRLLKQALSRQVQGQETSLSWQDIRSRLPEQKREKDRWINPFVYALSISMVVFLMIVRIEPTKMQEQFSLLVEISQDQSGEGDILLKSVPYMFKRRNL